VFFPAGADSSDQVWLRSIDCVWDGPSCLTNVRRLKLEYEDRFILFRTILKCPNASIADLIAEAKNISRHSSLKPVTEVFEQISLYIRPDSSVEIKKLKTFKMFPTTLGHGTRRSIEFQKADEEWYIPDILHVAKHFKKQRFLAFDFPTLKRLESLFTALKLEKKYLSEVATRTTTHGKAIRQNEEYQVWFRNRIRYVKG
jgi:hypothetical protein